MDKQLIKKIIAEQKKDIKKTLAKPLIVREIESKVKKSLADDLIKVITGVRRCGKSVLAHQALKRKKYGYVNFDDERLIGVTAQDMDLFLEVMLIVQGEIEYILLDEIQNVEGWELFVNLMCPRTGI